MQKTIEAGFILINKPAGRSSFSVVAQIKRLLREGGVKKPKVGHAGTLDPFATGLLIIAIGREATRCMTQMLKMDKTYRATVKFGLLTDTLDLTGTIIEENTFITVSVDMLADAVAAIGSSYQQIPPLYSALKFQGVRFYKMARKEMFSEQEIEKMLEKKRRTITIHKSTIISSQNDEAVIDVHVSHGTYVRTLMNDIAKQMNTVGTTMALARTTIGSWSLQDAHEVDAIDSFEGLIAKMISVEHFFDTV